MHVINQHTHYCSLVNTQSIYIPFHTVKQTLPVITWSYLSNIKSINTSPHFLIFSPFCQYCPQKATYERKTHMKPIV